VKKIIIILVCLTAMCITQAQETKQKHFINYGSFSTGVSAAKDVFFTLEAGKWGTDVPFTIGGSIDYVRNTSSGDKSWWLGIKPYYTINSQGKYSFFVWFSPKLNLSKKSDYLIEVGGGLQKQIKDTPWYIWYMFSTQSGNGFSHIPSVSIAINYAK
jgi:hypothetical protein